MKLSLNDSLKVCFNDNDKLVVIFVPKYIFLACGMWQQSGIKLIGIDATHKGSR